MAKYIDAERLKAEIEKNTPDTLQLLVYRDIILALIDSLQQEQQKRDSRSIPVLRADTTEKQDRILEIIGQDEIYCHFPLDFGKETDCGYEDYNDRVYIDGDLTFNKMAEIVDFLGKNSK